MREPARKAMATRTAMIILKTPAEIQQMRRAGALAAEALSEVVRAVRPGVTGTQMNTIAERYIRAQGGITAEIRKRRYQENICISENDEGKQGIDDEKPLSSGTQ